MNTLVRVETLQSHPYIVARISPPWTRRIPSFHHLHITNPLHIPTSKRTKELHAEARGFGVAVSADKNKKPVGKEDGGNNRGGGGGNHDVDDDDAIPQVVFDRMMRRVVFYVASPMAAGVASLCVLSVLKERGVWDVPPWLPFATTLVLFGTSAVGIAYGTLSTSWDPDEEGSLLGWREARLNWPQLWKDEEERR